MKKIFFLFAILISFNNLLSESFYENLNLKRVSSNFNGSVNNNKAILVYGNGGVILRSIDGGKSWNQINLNDSLNIIKIVALNNIFYGISNRNYIIFSENNGIDWNYKSLGNNADLINIFEKNDYLYIILKNKIIKLNKELEIVKDYNYNLDTSYYSFDLIGDKIIYSQGQGKLGYINFDNNEAGIIELSKLGICKVCHIPKSIFSNKQDLLYFFLNDTLYQININSNQTKFVYEFPYLESSVFYALDNEVFQLYNITDKKRNLDSLYFVKIDNINEIPIHIKLPGNDRYVSNLSFTSLQFISGDTIIAVGKGKLIYMSYDGGKNWELKSLLNQFSYLFLINNQNAFILSPFAQFFHTHNGGDTWLTQKNYSEEFYKNSCFKYPDIMSTLRYLFNDIGLYIATLNTNSDNLIYSIKGGDSIGFKRIGVENWTPYSEIYPFITKCFDKIIIINHIKSKPSPLTLFINRLNTDFNVEKKTQLQEKVFYAVYNLNDTLIAIGKDFDALNPFSNRYNVYISSDTATSWDINFSFEVDKGVYHHHIYRSSQVKHLIFLNWSFTKIINYDTVYYTKVYMLDIHKKTFTELIQEDSDFQKVFYFNGRYNFFRFVYDEIKKDFYPKCQFVENIDIDPYIWRKYKNYRYSPPLLNITEDTHLSFTTLVSDTLFAFVAYDSLFNEEVLFFARPKLPSSVEENYKTETVKPIYITNPVPSPAHNFANMKIYWDYWLNIDNADFSAINLLGLQVSGKEDFQFTKINSYSGELIWRPKALSPGVYIITVRIGTNSCSQLIVVD